MGEVLIGFFGPSCMDPVVSAAVEVLSMYLAGSSVSVLEQTMVEIDEPWASAVNFSTEDRPNMVIWVQLTAVETKNLEAAEKKLFEILKKTVDEPLNMKYMKDLIYRGKRQTKFYVETSGHTFATPIITDHLFGNRDGSELRKNLESLNSYDEILKWDDEKWRSFTRKLLVDNHHVSILGRPSAKLVKKIEEDEKARVAERVKRLGEEGLKKLQRKLEKAKAENDREIPPEIIGQFKVPSVDTIHFINTTTVRAGLAAKENKTPVIDDQSTIPVDETACSQKLIDQDDVDLPLYLHFESVPSEFVHVNIFISTANIPVKLRPLIPVYWELFFSSPVMINGTRVEYEQVVSDLEKDTVSMGISSGSYVDWSEVVRIRLQVEPEKYEASIKWLQTLLWDSIFDKKVCGNFVHSFFLKNLLLMRDFAADCYYNF
jgi:Zn-dependent M16 (insulinase) family peptidase